jgi:hypothetical protein
MSCGCLIFELHLLQEHTDESVTTVHGNTTTTSPHTHIVLDAMREVFIIHITLRIFSPLHCFFLQSKALYPDGMFL